MKTLVFIHGMRQEKKDPVKLKAAWEAALKAAWKRDGIVASAYNLVMPYYGDVLDAATMAVRETKSKVTQKGSPAATTLDATEQALYLALQKRANISDAQVRKELAQEVVARGPLNWEWVQGIARVLSEEAPWLGKAGLPFVQQVSAYLTRPHIRKLVNDIVSPALKGDCIVVSHSLGTIVAYNLLTSNAHKAKVPLFMTLGSPLGIDIVKQNIRPPALAIPKGASSWFNGVDERDYVALVSQLTAKTFCAGIKNITDIKNGKEDPHFIGDYLSDARVCKQIAVALSD
jgi:hypothetical protein